MSELCNLCKWNAPHIIDCLAGEDTSNFECPVFEPKDKTFTSPNQLKKQGVTCSWSHCQARPLDLVISYEKAKYYIKGWQTRNLGHGETTYIILQSLKSNTDAGPITRYIPRVIFEQSIQLTELEKMSQPLCPYDRRSRLCPYRFLEKQKNSLETSWQSYLLVLQ